MSEVALTSRETKLLEYLGQTVGADIYNYGDAVDGRTLQKHGLVDIGKAQKPPRSGAERQPYYGISINEQGRNWLAGSGILQRGVAA